MSGDRVAVQGDQVPGSGRDQMLFHRRRTKDGHVHVVPQDAVRFLQSVGGQGLHRHRGDESAVLAATDGTDPLSRAVDRLSRQHGTLFVVAAGNEGEALSVGSPAAARTLLSTVDGKVIAENSGVPVLTVRISGAFDDLNRAPAEVRVAQREVGGCGG